MKSLSRFLINVVLICVLIYSGYNIYKKLNDYKLASNTYEKAKTEEKENLSSTNPDFRFWLKVENTNIDYPVVQSKDNNYYLSKDFYNQDNSSGSIFMDYRNKSDDKNIILYGHNMKNKTMFNNILKFKDESFFKQNNKIYISTDIQDYIYEVFSVYTVDAGYDYLVTEFDDDKSFINYINDIKSNSLFNSNLEVNSSDTIITLSTCSYEFKDARTVVHAKLIDKKIP